MTREQFKSVKEGDTVVITIHGQNNGKMGIVRSIKRDDGFGGGFVNLEPLNCEFGFCHNDRRSMVKNGLYSFKHPFITFPKSQEETNGLSKEEIKVILKIAARCGCDRDGDILKLFVKPDLKTAIILDL